MDRSTLPWVSSLAFVVAGLVIAAGSTPQRGHRRVFGSLVAATGLGSVIQHGPDPGWADLAHDLPLVAVIAYVAVDAVADVTGRPLAAAFWFVPTLALVPLIVATPRPADAVQAVLAVVAVGFTVQRARVHPPIRRPLVTSLGLLAAGAVLGTLTRQGWPLGGGAEVGHSLWHVLAALALWRVAPTLGRHRAT